MSALRHNVADLVWMSPGSGIEIISMEVEQAISTLFTTKVLIKSEEQNLSFPDLLHSEVRIVLKCGDELSQDRIFSGIITRFSQQRTRFGNLPNAAGKRYLFAAEIRPRAWLLTRQFRSKVFQKMNAQDIVSEVLAEHGVAHQWQLSGALPTREYTVQYEESDFHFISRLLEREGICFYFDQEQDKMRFSDFPGGHDPCKPSDEGRYVEEISPRMAFAKQEFIRDFTYEEHLATGSFGVHHYNPETSRINLFSQTTQKAVPNFPALESYRHSLNFEDQGQGEQLASLQGEACVARNKVGQGTATCRAFEAGYTMTMKDHFRPELNITWLLTACNLSFEQGRYHCSFSAFPADLPYRPPLKTPLPKVNGLQTAIVTGPEGAKVYLDEMGRCKLQFHWEREGSGDERSSMWVRVSNNYAGKDYGIQWIPRIGHEVLVTFVNGDPDQPIVTGRVYNDFNTPPLGPAEKWQNIIKSIKDNHLMFDDKDGQELIDIRAEKDMNTLVVHDDTQSIGNNRTISVGADHRETIGKNMNIQVADNLSEQVGKNYTETVGVNLVTSVGALRQTTVGGVNSLAVSKDATETVGQNKSVTVKKKYMVKAGSTVGIKGDEKGMVDMKDELVLKVGGAKAVLKKNGDIVLEGKKINIKASGPIKLKGAKIDHN